MQRTALLALLLPLLLAVPLRAWPQSEPARRSENPLAAQAPEAPSQTGQLTKAPELLEFFEAAYPKEAEAARLTGSVGLLVDIDETGAVGAVEVSEPAGHGFDEAAVEAVRRFRFSPAEIDGAPAAVRIAYRYNFTLAPEPEPQREERTGVVNLRGRILQRGSREPVGGASLFLDDGTFGTTTAADGTFELADVPLGSHTIVAQAPGYDRYETEEEVVEGKITEVTLYIRKLVYGRFETVVRGKRERKEVARVELAQEEIRLVPGTAGDAFKVVQDLPGVNRAPYGVGLLIVRGGRPFDTRVYVDGIWIPLVFHFGGLTAAFNSDLLSGLSFQPGNFSAQYGRAVAGTVDARTRTPSKEGYHGYVNASLMDSSLLVEGPVNEAWSFAVAGRVSYVDLVLRQVLPSTIQFVSAPRYWDYQARLEYAPVDGRERFYAMFFGSDDSVKARLDNPGLIDPEGRSEAAGHLGFHRLMSSWTRSFSPEKRNTLTASLGFDTTSGSGGSDLGSTVDTWSAQLREAFAIDLAPSLTLETGFDLYAARYHADSVIPHLPLPGELPDPLVSRQLTHDVRSGSIFEPGVFLEATWKPLEGTRVVPGLRLDYEHSLRYLAFDPRLSLFQQLGEKTLLKGAVGLYQQPPDYRTGQWTDEFGNPALGPERSLQSMVGVERKLTEAISVDLQLYHKRLTRLSYQTDRTIERDGEQVLERWANVGEGHSYGAEILLRHELTRNFFGWVSYSYSRSLRRNTLSESPDYRTGAYDQPHHLVAVASYKWPYDWVTGLRFQFSSGALLTPISQRVYDADGDLYLPIPGEWYAERGPAFVSLDLRVDKRFVFERWSASVFLDVQNVTNNINAEYVAYNFDYTQRKYVRGLPIFPSLGVKAEF